MGRRPLRSRAVAATVTLLAVCSVLALLFYGLSTQSPNTTIDDALASAHAVQAPAYHLAVLREGALGPALTEQLRRIVADGRVSARELRGRPYVLNFWASWCVPCREEAPRLERAWRNARRSAMLVVGLDMQDITGDARRFMDIFGIDYLNIRDPSNDIARTYGVTGVPETFFISARGQVVGHVIGVITDAQLKAGIAAARAGRPQAALEGGARKPTR
jgi:thiol-disulfide isomerase/thioredoxin